MDTRCVLIFVLDGKRFGVDAAKVHETVWLPELTPIEEAPPWVSGIFSLRGEIVVVTDLRRRFGHPAGEYLLSDQVVVLKIAGLTLGLIVGEVLDVVDVPAANIQTPPEFETAKHGWAPLISGVACVGDELISLLELTKLATHIEPTTDDEEEHSARGSHFFPSAAPEMRARLRARAMALRQVGTEDRGAGLGLAIVVLAGEYFGIELAAVQAFCHVGPLTPIPCCPPHILGAMNLRGNLLTLIDPSSALNLRPTARRDKAVIARIAAGSGTDSGEQLIAMAVEDVHDVIYLRSEQLQAPPAALREQCEAEIIATAPYAGKTVTIVDLPALLARQAWIVDETV